MANVIEDNDPRIATGHQALDAYWKGVGKVDADLMSYLINPQFQGKPAWPNTRQAYRVVRRDATVIIASDGLSDPFVGTDMDDSSGFGMEVFIETPDVVGATFDELRASWAFQVIENFAMNVADWGGITGKLQKHGAMSTEFPAQGLLPAAWLTPNGTAGYLINVPPGRQSDLTLPFGPVMVVALTLLTPTETAFIVQGGAAARRELVTKLGAPGVAHLSSLKRPSVV